MPESAPSQTAVDRSSSRIRRRKYMVDFRLQMAITVQLLGVLFGVGLLYVLGVYFLPGTERIEQLGSRGVREVFLRANAIYFGLGAAILGVLAVLLTHRVAGPAFVLKRAVDGMREGRLQHRLVLRKRDYLKPLARSVAALCEDLLSRRAERRRCLDHLARCLDEGDLEAAHELVARLRSTELGGHEPDAKAGDGDASGSAAEPAATSA